MEGLDINTIMKALLDTNIIIHRETNRIFNVDIGNLFLWLDKLNYEKCIHKVTISEIEKFIADIHKSTMKEFQILSDCFAVNKRIVDLSFPKSAFIVMIKRNNEYIRPGGSTLILANDTLMVLADKEEDFEKVNICLNKKTVSIKA